MFSMLQPVDEQFTENRMRHSNDCEKGKKKIGILGFAFNVGIDDLRESPVFSVIERLVGKGYNINLYEKKFRWQNSSAQTKNILNAKFRIFLI